MNTIKWEKREYSESAEGDGFYISYNPNTGATSLGVRMTDLANTLGGDVRDGEEIALVINDSMCGHKFLILEGDFRKEYGEAFAGGIEACMKVYNDNKEEHGSNWSND